MKTLQYKTLTYLSLHHHSCEIHFWIFLYGGRSLPGEKCLGPTKVITHAWFSYAVLPWSSTLPFLEDLVLKIQFRGNFFKETKTIDSVLLLPLSLKQFCGLEKPAVAVRFCTCLSYYTGSTCKSGPPQTVPPNPNLSILVRAPHLWQSWQVRCPVNFRRKFWQRLSPGALGNRPVVPYQERWGWVRAPSHPRPGGGARECPAAGRGGGYSSLAGGSSATVPASSTRPWSEKGSWLCRSFSLFLQKLRLPLTPLTTHSLPSLLSPPPLSFLRKSAAENSQKVPDVKSLAWGHWAWFQESEACGEGRNVQKTREWVEPWVLSAPAWLGWVPGSLQLDLSQAVPIPGGVPRKRCFTFPTV